MKRATLTFMRIYCYIQIAVTLLACVSAPCLKMKGRAMRSGMPKIRRIEIQKARFLDPSHSMHTFYRNASGSSTFRSGCTMCSLHNARKQPFARPHAMWKSHVPPSAALLQLPKAQRMESCYAW